MNLVNRLTRFLTMPIPPPLTQPSHTTDLAKPPTGLLDNHDLAAQDGWGIALGFRAVTNAGLTMQGSGVRTLTPLGGTDVNKTYSPDSIAAVMGFSGTDQIRDVPPNGQCFKLPKMWMFNVATSTTAWNSGHKLRAWRLIMEYFPNKNQLMILSISISTKGKELHSFAPPNEACCS